MLTLPAPSAAARPEAARRGGGQVPAAVVPLACLVAAVCVVSLLLRWAVPAFVIADAGYDDLLFAGGADRLRGGDWLGRFDPNLTLSKGIGYPVFLAVCAAIGLPALLAQQLMLLLGAGLIARVGARATGSRLWGLLLFTVLALDPSFTGTESSRIIRDGWYAAVSLLLFGAVASLSLPRTRQRRPVGVRIGGAVLQGGAAGLLLAMYWLGREERPWLVPALGVLIVGAVLCRKRPSAAVEPAEQPARVGWRWRVGAGIAAGAVFVVVVQGVALKNDAEYGARLTTDVTEGAFADVFGQWQSVDAGPRRQYVPISKQQRAAVYEVSPAARELQPFIEGPETDGLVAPGCQALRVCDDIAGGWTQWAIRQAVALTGDYDSAGEAQAYYHRLSGEIETACARGQLRCDRVMPSLLPDPDNIRPGAYAESFLEASTWLVRFRMAEQRPDIRSSGQPANYAVFARSVVGIPDTLPEQQAREQAYAPWAESVGLVGEFYGRAVPLLLVAALGGLVLAPLRRRRGWGIPWVLAAAAAAAVLTRLALLALVDSTSFPAAETVYSLPASSPLLVFAILGVWLLTHALAPQPQIGQSALTAVATPAATPAPPPRAPRREQTPFRLGPPTPELTVLLPCLDEAATVGTCITKARTCLDGLGVSYEVLVADNGSTDGSQELAREAGAHVIDVPQRGYGAALRSGIAAARGRYVLMADADDSYALDDMGPFVVALRAGNDLVMGNRFAGGVAPGAMPALHRYLGNPVLSFLGRRFFRIPVRDFHCGMRAFDREKAEAVDLRCDGMEFASELVVKFALAGHQIAEVPTTLRPDGRDRAPHLRSWRDGWRHLRFLLLFSPRWLFLYPGVLMTVAGGALMARLAFGPLRLGETVLDTQSLLFCGAIVAVGVQAVLFAVLSRTFATARGMLPPSHRLTTRRPTLERGVGVGLLSVALGGAGFVTAVVKWAQRDFGPLELADSMRLAIPSATFLTIGAQILLASFFLGLLHLDRVDDEPPTGAAPTARPPGRSPFAPPEPESRP